MFDSDIGEVAELAIETDNEESLGFDEDHLVETDANNEDERDNEKLIEIVGTVETGNEESLGFDEEHLVEIDANNEYERDNEKLIDNEEMVDRKVIVEILGAVHK